MISSILARNNVQIIGTGETTLLFAHGFGCDQNMWRLVAPEFEDHYRVVLFDYVGGGCSDVSAYSPQRYSNLHGYARDVLEICEALDLEQAVFVGHSVSAMIGLLASIAAPQRFSHLLMVAPSACYINHQPDYVGGFERREIEELLELMDKNFLGWASFLAPVVIGPDSPSHVSELEESFCSTDPKIARRFAEVTFYADNRADLKKCVTPSLILQCSDDVLAPLGVGEYLHRHLQDSTLKVIEATGHCPHLTHPQQTIRAIQDYLTAQGL